MTRFIIGTLFVVLGVVLILVRQITLDGVEKPKINVWKAGIPIVIIGMLFGMWGTVRVVPPRSVGIEVTFGKVTGALDSGLHFVKPWTSVKNFPATVQTLKAASDGNGFSRDCITVRLANQTTACIDVTLQWSVDTADKQGVENLYAKWRSFDHIQPNLVGPQLAHALMAPFEAYDPIKVLTTNGQLVVPVAEMERQVKEQLVQNLGSGVVVNQLSINLIRYDQTTQDKINAYAQAIADTRVAEQRLQTAEAQRRANDALAASSASKDPAVLIQNCLDLTERLTKEGKGLPAAWTCLGAGSQTVVPVR